LIKILEELRADPSTNYKQEVLAKHKDNELLQRLLKMTYDKVAFTYGITMKNVNYNPDICTGELTLDDALGILEALFSTRRLTGHAALAHLEITLESLGEDDARIIELVLGRDLKCGIGKTYINKVWKNLIVKPPYMRCGIYSGKTAKRIVFPAFLQLKADGRYVAVTVENGKCTFMSRSGEEQDFMLIAKVMSNYPDGVYTGEFLVEGMTDRSLANGMINSSKPDHSKIYIHLWDYISLDEYARGKDKKNKTAYSVRFTQLRDIVGDSGGIFVKIIPWLLVESLQEALTKTSEWMEQGYEGSILKDRSNIFCDHTSPTQLKLKLEIELEVRCTGFTEGTKGTSREATFGAMTYCTDDGEIRGQTSGFTDDQLTSFNSVRDEYIGEVFTILCNDITKSRTKDYHALSHPRFIEFRKDKDTTDSLERALEQKQSAMELT